VDVGLFRCNVCFRVIPNSYHKVLNLLTDLIEVLQSEVDYHCPQSDLVVGLIPYDRNWELPENKHYSETIQRPLKVQKVQEAGWQFLYYASFVSFGLYAIKDEPYFFDSRYFWIGYPHIEITYKLKVYYLLQFAFWFHMVFVWCVEAKRKDYLQMITHHFVTIFMVGFSYNYNWTHIGSAILLNLDCADLLLYFTKLINYIKYQTLSNIMFIVFTLVWIVTRHYLFIIIVLSVWNDGYKLPFKWDHSIGYYWTPVVYYVFMVGFLILQTLFILWFITIVKLIIRVLRTPDDVKDTRSDSDSEDDKPKQT